MIGHVEDQTTLPLGCLAELDAGAGTLRLLEAPVK
jgi:muramoyltetrapeptide carboxypeptidase LdcA involved in peptidoglycan recycling